MTEALPTGFVRLYLPHQGSGQINFEAGEEATMRFHLTLQRRHRDVLSETTIYYVTDRLHDGRAVQVPGHQIASIVSAWLAELGADSPLVEDLARAARVGDWASACAVGNQLSVAVSVAAAA